MTSPLDSLAARCAELSIADLVKPGVYVLLNAGAIAYIGESNNVLVRVGTHAKQLDFDRVLYFAEEDKRERRAIESALARRFNPPNCDVYSRRDIDRDPEILSRFGLEPDPGNSRIVLERAAACWSTESQRSGARQRCYFAALKRARAEGKSEQAAARAAHKARRDFDAAPRLLRVRRQLWQAVQPFVAPNLSHTLTVSAADPGRSVSVHADPCTHSIASEVA